MTTKVICPYCYTTYQSLYEWGDNFYDNHPIIAFIDKYFPYLNTPPPEAKYINHKTYKND